MLRWGDRPILVGMVGLCSATLVGGAIVAAARSLGGARAPEGHPRVVGGGVTPPTPERTTNQPAEPVPRRGQSAWIDVAVANLWAAPDLARPLDDPSLGKPVDMARWLSAMSVADRRWLVDRLVTQALYGDRVTVLETAGAWTRVAVARQPSSLDRRGYPGWVPTVQLGSAPRTGPGARTEAVVITPATVLHDPAEPGRALMELSFDTALPVVASDAAGVTVATPGGGSGRLASSDVEISPSERRRPTGTDVVGSAQLFAGLPYLWAGTSGLGFDCSGLTAAAYAAHGVVIPRDAADQVAAGTAVDRADLQPGDLLFFATAPGAAGRSTIHHVGMYVGNGRMIQSPATGRTVETVAIDRPGLAAGYWGARRYLPTA